MNSTERPTVGLALSGGTAKSMAHVGVLEALFEAGIPVDYLAGTSGGAIVASIYAAGFSVGELKQVASSLRWKDLARLTWPRLGLLNNSGIDRFLTDLLGDLTFEDLKIPLAIVGTDLLTGEKVVFREGRVSRAAMISSSIPNVFEPVEMDGTLYVDGGLTEYLPVETVQLFEPDIIIAVNLGYRPGRSPRPRHLLHMSMRVIGIAAMQNARLSEARADIVIRPPTAEFPSFDLMASSRLIQVGYEATKERIPDIHAVLVAAEPSWVQKLKFWERKGETQRGQG
jgi:NTE family protein